MGGKNAIVLGPILREEGEWPLLFLSCILEKVYVVKHRGCRTVVVKNSFSVAVH